MCWYILESVCQLSPFSIFESLISVFQFSFSLSEIVYIGFYFDFALVEVNQSGRRLYHTGENSRVWHVLLTD